MALLVFVLPALDIHHDAVPAVGGTGGGGCAFQPVFIFSFFFREYEESKKKKSKRRDAPDTGQWECVHRAKHTVSRPLACLSHDFVCHGVAVPIGPPRRRK